MRFRISFGALLVIITTFATAQESYTGNRDWEQVCEKAKARQYSLRASGPLKERELADCDESALYYGFGAKPDYRAALQCGLYQRAHPQDTVANMFYGPGVLTMLYANGKGVSRNYALAIHFACEQTWAANAEQALRIGHLEYLRDTGSRAKNFDLCDDVTSGLNQGACAGIASRAADANREAKLKAIARSIPVASKNLFATLSSAEEAFEKSRIETEIDLTGTARAAFQFADKTKLRDQFVINLERFGKGDIPSASKDVLAKLKSQLRSVYQQTQTSPAETWQDGTVKPEGICRTQQHWETLTRAWIDFGRIAYPTLPTDRIYAQLIRLRLHQLQILASLK